MLSASGVCCIKKLLTHMKEYTIYHIPGTKIGVSYRMDKRMKDQGFTDWEILEVHTDIYEASDREQELQREYGYRVDKTQYWQSVENIAIGSSSGGKANKNNPKSKSHIANLSKSNSLLLDKADAIRERFEKANLGTSQFSHKYAEEYNVSAATIWNIIKGKIY